MRRKRRKFKGHVFSLRPALIRPALLWGAGLFVLVLFMRSGISLPSLRSQVLLQCLERSILSLQCGEKKIVRFSAYDILADSVLSIRASEAMSKKYAAKYGGVVKKEQSKAPAPTGKPQHLDGNVLETDASAGGLTFINTPGYPVDAGQLLEAPLSFVSKNSEPRVLIIHTHTSEAYSESPDARSDDPAYNVVSVGDAIAKALNDAGVMTLHDTTQNDYPSYNQSYKKAMSLIDENLTRHPTLEVVLDIHRDYIKRDDGTMVKPTIAYDGQKAAQIMFVIGTDHMGLEHPNWRHNLSFAVKIQNQLNQTHPGLCRSLNLRTERFNQHMTKGSMIIEVGAGVNSLEEAKRSGQYLGEAIAAILKNN